MKNLPNSISNSWIQPINPLSIWLKLATILLVSVLIKAQPTHPTWAVIMILLAAFIIVPIGFQLFTERSVYFKNRFKNTQLIYYCHLLSTMAIAVSFTLEQGMIAGILALPYAFWCAFIAVKILKLDFKINYITLLASWGFLTNAALWCVADRFNYQPWNFSPWIILLTGAHFHYAGFTLTLALALFLNENPDDIIFKNSSRAILLGIVLTAVGITTTQLGYSTIIETFASVWMAISAFCVGCAVILRGYLQKGKVKVMWLSGGICLVMGMCLALGYALRHFIIIDWLSIPHMQAVHGSLNALGFGTLIIMGWLFKD